jgi:hypothetical protein
MKNPRLILILLMVLFLTVTAFSTEIKSGEYAVFQFTHTVVLPGNPEKIYDAVTGDISGWWDHSFTKEPLKFYLEPKPSGGFYEIFDDSGDGVLHTIVIFAQRGKMLRFDGPLGLSGQAVQGVYTYYLESVTTDSTQMKVDISPAKLIQNLQKSLKMYGFILFMNAYNLI